MKLHQCRFEQERGDGVTLRDVGWIPDRGAKVGNKVELKGREGLWTVTSVGMPGIEPDRLYRKQIADRASLPSITKE